MSKASKMKRIASVVMASTVLMGLTGVSTFNAKADGYTQEYSGKTLYIGLGTNGILDWMAKAKADFMERYGINVEYSFASDYKDWDKMPNSHSKYKEKLFITESLEAPIIEKFALDITDVVSSPISSKESKSILDKMDPIFKNYYKTDDDKYFAVPAQICTIGFVYDMDLFEEHGFYFANAEYVTKLGEDYITYLGQLDDEIDDKFINPYTGKEGVYYFVEADNYDKDDLSAGPDGVQGTYDDGLPATYEEFFALCQYMVDDGVEPIRWAGNVPAYANDCLKSLAADFEGEDYLLCMNYDGKANHLVEFDNNGNIVFDENGMPKTYSKDIYEDNGYLLSAQAGYYFGLKFFETVVNNPDFYDKTKCFGSHSNLQAQIDYVQSRNSQASDGADPIAMLIEGSWWMGEASSTFASMAGKYGQKWSMANRNFGFMPMPKVSKEYVGTKASTSNVIDMTAFISSSADADQAAMGKLFLKYMMERDSLLDFVKTTGQIRPYELELTDAEYNELNGFGKSNYNINKYTNILFQRSRHDLYMSNPSCFSTAACKLHFDTGLTSVPTQTMMDDGITAKTYFEKVYKHWTENDAEEWVDNFEDYFVGGETPTKTGGCFGSVGMTFGSVALILGVAVVLRKKSKND